MAEDSNVMESMGLSELMGVFRKSADRYSGVLSKLRSREIPESYVEFRDNELFPIQLERTSLILRNAFLEVSGCCLVAYDWVRPLSKWIGSRKCLEVMCGCGCLAKAFQDCGVDIIATDDFSWENHQSVWFQNPWTEIEQISAVDAVRKYGSQVSLILISWPYMDGTALEVLREMRIQNSKAQMIFIGEWGGAAADKNFFQEARRVEDSRFYDAVKSFCQHASIHDYPYLLR